MKTLIQRCLVVLSMLIVSASSLLWQADMLVTQPETSDCQADLPRIFNKIEKLIYKEIDPNAIVLANGEIRGANIPDIGLGRNPCEIAGYCKTYPTQCLLLGCPLGSGRRELQTTNSTIPLTDDDAIIQAPDGLPPADFIARLGTRRLRKLKNTDPACLVDQLEFFFAYK